VFRESDIVGCDIANLFQDSIEKQHQQLEAKLKEQSEQMKEQSEQLEAKLRGKLEVKLNEHSDKLSEQFQEAVRQLSECHKVCTITVL